MSQQYAIFRLNDESFGVNIAHITEIVWPQEVFNVPDTPEHIEGLINLRGKVYALLNLKKKLDLPETKTIDEEAKMLIITMNSQTLALMVDVVDEIVPIEEEDIQPIPESASSHYKKYLSGSVKVKERLILLLGLESILDYYRK